MSKPLTVARLNDAVLGSFSRVPQSAQLDHAVRYLSTWSGSDKLFMVITYAAKLIIPLLELRARVQHRAGMGPDALKATTRAVSAWKQLASVVGDARMLWRIWGLLPIVQWLIALERAPPPTRALLTIERLQGWAMLAYYPLEHAYYLAAHGILPWRIPAARVSRWSCRFWAAYVLLQFAHLREDARLIAQRERALKGTSKETEEAAWADIAKRKDAVRNEFIVNLGYLPLTMHWSIEGGLFSEVWTGVFGMIAAVASFRGGWEATKATPVRK